MKRFGLLMISSFWTLSTWALPASPEPLSAEKQNEFFAFTHGVFSVGNFVTQTGVIHPKEGERDGFVTFSPTILAGAHFRLQKNKQLYFHPEIFFVWPSENADESVTKTEFGLRYDFVIHWNNWAARFGNTILMTNLNGKGGEVQVGQQSFFRPDSKELSINSSLDAGLEFFVTNHLSLRLNMVLISPFNAEKARLGHLLTLNYYLPWMDKGGFFYGQL